MSIQPHVPANLADLTGDEWQTLAADLDAYEASIATEAQKRFERMIAQHAKGLMTNSDLWAETVMLVLGTPADDLLPADAMVLANGTEA